MNLILWVIIVLGIGMVLFFGWPLLFSEERDPLERMRRRMVKRFPWLDGD